MVASGPQTSLDKLIRKERGERLYQARFEGRTPALVFRCTAVGRRLDEEDVRNLERIQMGLETVSSPSVPALLQWELRDERVLEYTVEDCMGVTVAEMAGSETLPLPQAVALWENLITALDPLHKQGLAYGLCHPTKLMVDRKGRILLPEPGVVPIVSITDPSELTYASPLFQRLFVGPDFVPPELLREGRSSTTAIDVFQSAVLFFRLVTGESPFGSGMSLEVYNRMLKGQSTNLLTLDSNCPVALSRLVADCLLPDPSARPSDAIALRKRLIAVRTERCGLAEPIVRRPEARYSQRFAEILSVHEGGNGNVDSPERLEDSAGLMEQVEKEALLGQLEQLRKSRRTVDSGSTNRLKVWLAIGAVALLSIVLAPYLLPDGPSDPEQYRGVKPLDGDGATHHEMVWDENTSRLHPTVRSLLDSVPLQVKMKLIHLGVNLEGKRSFIPPVLPPYRIQIRSDEGEVVVLELSARNRLHSVVLPSTLMPEGITRYALLYDAQGTARLILGLSAGGKVVTTTPVVAFE